MVTPRHLDKAPITEALVDIRVKPRPNIDLPTLQSVAALFAGEYPEKQELIQMQGTFSVKKIESGITSVAETGSVINGYLCTSPDKKQVVQVRLDGFSLSRLRPYETWGNLREEAHRLWQLYFEKTSPESVIRVALRYINRLEIPFPIRDFSDYLTAPPTIPQNLPQELIRFLTQNVIHEPSLEFVATISQLLEPAGASNVVSVILDIDVSKEVQYNVAATEIWKTLDQMREFKNKIFFGSITKKSVELYK